MDGAGSLRHVWHHLYRPPGPAADSDLERVWKLPVAKRLSAARGGRARKLPDRDPRRRVISPIPRIVKAIALGSGTVNVNWTGENKSLSISTSRSLLPSSSVIGVLTSVIA